MPIGPRAFAEKKFLDIDGRRMAFIDEGDGDAIVFQHGNPTSSYLWRNVMPHCRGLGRLVACDLIGMGDSDKLAPSGPTRYTFAEQREYLHALWDALALGDRVVLVLHDWGSALGFDWAHTHRDRVQGIAYMEALVMPVTWADWPDNARKVFQGFRSPAGEELVLQKNIFVERVLPGSVLRGLTDDEMAVYRKPFAQAGEDRRPTLTWPRQIPIDGEPAEVVQRGRALRGLAGREPGPQALRQCRARLDPHRPAARVLPRPGRTRPKSRSRAATSSRKTARTRSAPRWRRSCAGCGEGQGEFGDRTRPSRRHAGRRDRERGAVVAAVAGDRERWRVADSARHRRRLCGRPRRLGLCHRLSGGAARVGARHAR